MTAAGYRTGLIGKYLNGWPAQIRSQAGGTRGSNSRKRPATTRSVTTCATAPRRRRSDEFQMDYLRGQADTFMAGSQPWFLVLTPTAPHFPFSPDGDDVFGWSDVRWPIVNEVDVSDKPSWISGQRPLPASAFSNLRATARAQLRSGTSLDRAIGVIINGLAPVVLDNTLIIYSSDNGLVYGEHHLPFVGIFKNDAYDPGLRVPLVMRGPGITPGVSVEPVSIAADITATVLAAGGATAQLTSDGVDLHDMIANPGAYTARQILHSKDVATNFGASPARRRDQHADAEAVPLPVRNRTRPFRGVRPRHRSERVGQLGQRLDSYRRTQHARGRPRPTSRRLDTSRPRANSLGSRSGLDRRHANDDRLSEAEERQYRRIQGVEIGDSVRSPS